jgi:high-affinity nickel-transport protein
MGLVSQADSSTILPTSLVEFRLALPNPFDDEPGRARPRLAGIYSLLVAANVAAWAWAYLAFRDHPVLLGTAFLAYVLGLRHAFDADHIAAIDNVVRKLMQQERRPLTAGLFFSLGHSTIVVLASAAIAGSAAALQGPLGPFHELGGIVGTLVSAFFLLLIGVANLLVLKGIWAAFARARSGARVGEEELDALLAGRGFLSRLFRPLFAVVSRSWHMYPIGLLFGLGFDTATEIGLLGISATQAAQGMGFWTILVFPALFTAAWRSSTPPIPSPWSAPTAGPSSIRSASSGTTSPSRRPRSSSPFSSAASRRWGC